MKLSDNYGANGTATTAQGIKADSAMQPRDAVAGNCRLTYVDIDEIKLMPYNGNSIKIAGDLHEIPSAGVALDNTGLSVDTLYYIYAYDVAGTLTLTASVTGHSTDSTAGNIGVEIMTGDNTKTLVGMVYTYDNGGTPEYRDSDAARLVLSWFNRQTKVAYAAYTGSPLGSVSTTPVSLGAVFDLSFLKWGSGRVKGSVRGVGTVSTTGNTVYFGSMCDAVNVSNVICDAYANPPGGDYMNLNGHGWSESSYGEGYHTAYLYAYGSAATAFSPLDHSLGHSVEIEG